MATFTTCCLAFLATFVCATAVVAGSRLLAPPLGGSIGLPSGLGDGTDCTPKTPTTSHSASQPSENVWTTVDTLDSKISCTTGNVDYNYEQIVTSSATVKVDKKTTITTVSDRDCTSPSGGSTTGLQVLDNSVMIVKTATSSSQATVQTLHNVHTMTSNKWNCDDADKTVTQAQTKTLEVTQELKTTLQNTTKTTCTNGQLVCFNNKENDQSANCIDQTKYCSASPPFECIPATNAGAYTEAQLRSVCGGTTPSGSTVMPTTPVPNHAGSLSTGNAYFLMAAGTLLMMLKIA